MASVAFGTRVVIETFLVPAPPGVRDYVIAAARERPR